jgi:hypothetical protein
VPLNRDFRLTDLELTALHEAGHVVAHARLGILQDTATIVASDGRAGASVAEGAGHVWSKEQAGPMVLAYCAGYAALIAAGHPEEVAARGCDDDFEEAAELIGFWCLGDGLDEWKARAAALMGAPENVRAVRLVAEHLMERGTLDADYLGVLVELADGECTQEEFKQWLGFWARCRQSDGVA